MRFVWVDGFIRTEHSVCLTWNNLDDEDADDDDDGDDDDDADDDDGDDDDDEALYEDDVI